MDNPRRVVEIYHLGRSVGSLVESDYVLVDEPLVIALVQGLDEVPSLGKVSEIVLVEHPLERSRKAHRTSGYDNLPALSRRCGCPEPRQVHILPGSAGTGACRKSVQ